VGKLQKEAEKGVVMAELEEVLKEGEQRVPMSVFLLRLDCRKIFPRSAVYGGFAFH